MIPRRRRWRSNSRASLAATDTSQGRRRSGWRNEPSLRQMIGQADWAASCAMAISPLIT